jgi:hypothetical protein
LEARNNLVRVVSERFNKIYRIDVGSASGIKPGSGCVDFPTHSIHARSKPGFGDMHLSGATGNGRVKLS